LLSETQHSFGKLVVGSLVGAFLIAATTILSLVAVSGLSVLFDVPFTGFSTMSFVLSVGFAVEYSVHVVARWLRASPDLTTSIARVEYTMSFLVLPTFMSFVSSTIGVACLAFTEFEFNKTFFFRPLIIVMFVTYFYGCWWLPVCLTLLDFDQVKLGRVIQENEVLSEQEKHLHVSGKEEDAEEEKQDEEEEVDEEFEQAT
jgi:predicted RND superfamily exporter protein